MSNDSGTLFVVATPIGNLDDISARALHTLAQVDLIAAEDTRHSQRLLRHYGITTPLTALHEHNERHKTLNLIRQLQQGKSIALISDAGTPLVSDPGYVLVNAARDADITVTPIPGPSAAIAALSAAGLPSHCFQFCGFIPTKAAARRSSFESQRMIPCTLIYYESPRRIQASLLAMVEVFGGERQAVVARELTKRFETIRRDSLARLSEWLQQEPDHSRGEFVVLLAPGAQPSAVTQDLDAETVLRVLLDELSTKQAASLAARLLGGKKSEFYQLALKLKDTTQP